MNFTSRGDKMPVIEINNVTKDFGGGKGNFDVSFNLEEGEVLGFLGPNGAGKTTTIRQIMGFLKADRGYIKVKGMDAFTEAYKIAKYIGYLPGEIAFVNSMTGEEFINFIHDMKGLKDKKRMKDLMDRFDLDPRGPIKKMSKGMKQKIGLVCAFMGDSEILILDEPTSGLDPLMQTSFVDLIKEENKRGKSILMSSHMFEEVDKTCSRTAIIRQGRIVAVEDKNVLSKNLGKEFIVGFKDKGSLNKFIENKDGYKLVENKVILTHIGDINELIKELTSYNISDIETNKKSLEDVFLHYYGGDQ